MLLGFDKTVGAAIGPLYSQSSRGWLSPASSLRRQARPSRHCSHRGAPQRNVYTSRQLDSAIETPPAYREIDESGVIRVPTPYASHFGPYEQPNASPEPAHHRETIAQPMDCQIAAASGDLGSLAANHA